MFRMFSLLLSFAVLVGCGTPSDVHLGERRFEKMNPNGEMEPSFVAEGHFWYTDPMTTAAAEGQMLWNFELAKSLEAVRTATTDAELEFAKKQMAAIQAAKPAEPAKVTGRIINLSVRDLICTIYADAGKTRRLGRVVLPPANGPDGTVREFTVVKGTLPCFVFSENGKAVFQRSLDNPADLNWFTWVK
ncbi:MAG: hypothetical protein Q7S23_03485 [bacterium]|nr:hypothetical protein [bacterium]